MYKILKITITCILIMPINNYAKNLNKNQVEGNFYCIFESDVDNKDGKTSFYWKSKNKDISFAKKNNLADFCIWRLNGNMSDKHLTFTKEEYDDHDINDGTKIRVFFAILKNQNLIIYNKNAFNLNKPIKYSAYKISEDFLNKYYNDIEKIITSSYQKESVLIKKTKNIREVNTHGNPLWNMCIISKKKLYPWFLTGDYDFKPFSKTKGLIEMNKTKPNYWDYKSFQYFKNGWNNSIININKLIKRLETIK